MEEDWQRDFLLWKVRKKMSERELRQFKEINRLRQENREMQIIMTIWAIAICVALVLIP